MGPLQLHVDKLYGINSKLSIFQNDTYPFLATIGEPSEFPAHGLYAFDRWSVMWFLFVIQ
jgi:hypothetical protein